MQGPVHTVQPPRSPTEATSNVWGDAAVCGLTSLGASHALVRWVSPRRSTDEVEARSYLIETEVAIVGAGRESCRRASALRNWLCGPDDEAITHLVLLAEAERHEHEPWSNAEAHGPLKKTLEGCDLVVVVMGNVDGWRTLFQGSDALLGRVSRQKIMAVYPNSSDAELVHLAQRSGWPAAVNIARDLAGFVGSHGASDHMLPGIPEALLAAVTRPGLICFDYADYLKSLGNGPGLVRAGVGIAAGDNRVDEAADMALAHLQEKLPRRCSVTGGMSILGLPIDGLIPEVEHACQRFEAKVSLPATEGCQCAAPVCLSDSGVLTCICVVSTRAT